MKFQESWDQKNLCHISEWLRNLVRVTIYISDLGEGATSVCWCEFHYNAKKFFCTRREIPRSLSRSQDDIGMHCALS